MQAKVISEEEGKRKSTTEKKTERVSLIILSILIFAALSVYVVVDDNVYNFMLDTVDAGVQSSKSIIDSVSSRVGSFVSDENNEGTVRE